MRNSAGPQSNLDQFAGELEELMGTLKDSKGGAQAIAYVATIPSAPQPDAFPEQVAPDPDEEPLSNALAPTINSIYKAAGLQPAPAEFGEGMYLASEAQIEQIVDFRLQKVHASLKALKRYTKELELELSEREEELDKVFTDLQAEQETRKSVEVERDQLMQQRLIMEAKMVEDQQVHADAEKEVEEMDRKAEEVAEAVARGELTEEEALEIEEELIRAQAKRLAAQQVQERNSRELDGLKAAAEEAAQRADRADADAERLQQQLEALQAEVARAKEEKDAESKLKEQAEVRFKSLVERLQAKVAEDTGGAS